MTREPHLRKIIAGLAGSVDPNLFEACAVDLLRGTYPLLVPVVGGQDAGMDGAIGEDSFLVVTTRKDFLRNLTESLDSQLSQPRPRSRVVFATSQPVTSSMRRKLEKRAAEKGFALINIHDQHDIAARLSRNSKWARELLAVTGDSSALSDLPSGRLLLRVDLPLIGRDADSKWLRETRGDRVLAGQPGSGKTHLLLALVREGRALFLASDDEARIANDLREYQPPVVIVDDAHSDSGRLQRLRRLRQSIGATFDIVATTWPGGYLDQVVADLGHIPKERLRELEGLTRSEIAEVLRAIGISAPDDDPWFRFLVDQSHNRPGLAVLLGTLWLRGEGGEVLSGKALSRSLVPALREVLHSDPIRLLACFALGGDGGMRLEVVADFLGISRDQAHAQSVGAAHGGVLEAIERDRLAVQPRTLRAALLAEVFFTQPGLDHGPLLEVAEKRSDAVEEVVAAAHAGAAVTAEELRRLVLGDSSNAAWEGLATLDESHGRWVLDHYPHEIVDIAHAVLQSVPGKAIQRLLDSVPPDDEPLHSQPRHPLRVLQDWIQEIPFSPGTEDLVLIEESLWRRDFLVEQVERFIARGGNREVGLRAGLLALSATLESQRESYTGGSVSFRSGHLSASSTGELLKSWRRLKPYVTPLTSARWRALVDVLDQWTHLRALGTDVDVEDQAGFEALAATVIEDLCDQAPRSPGLAVALAHWAERIDVPLSIPVDEELTILFPSDAHLTADNWKEVRQEQRKAAETLGRDWAERNAEVAVKRLVFFLAEAQSHGLYEDMLSPFFTALAAEVSKPEDWLRSALRNQLSPGWTYLFMARVVREQPSGWEALMEQCLRSQPIASLTADELLKVESVPDPLLRRALRHASARLIHGSCLRREIPLPRVRELLLHPSSEVAHAAAVGVWGATTVGEIPAEIESEWRSVVLAAGEGGEIDRSAFSHHLKAILSRRPDLSIAWLRRRLADVLEFEIVTDHGVYAAAVGSLDPEARMQLVDDLPKTPLARRLIPALVGSSPDVYRRLLKRKDLVDYHLAPLSGRAPDREWAALAQGALEAGHEPDEVASAAFLGSMLISGFGEGHWRRWLGGFEELRQAADGPLREVAERGRARADALVAEALAQRRRFELTAQR